VRACDIALVLAIDVSGSVDAFEFGLQTEGIAQAIRDPDVTDALVRGQVALAVVQWSGADEQAVTLPWTRVREPVEASRLAGRIAGMPRAFGGGNTAVGEAIGYATNLFDEVGDCAHWVIDVSGDGDENEGFTLGNARRAAWARGIAINGLAIEAAGPASPITQFYQRWVVTPGGFVITAAQHLDFERAMTVKMRRELIPPMAGPAGLPHLEAWRVRAMN
jgi:Ca-activated chloride channel family protein